MLISDDIAVAVEIVLFGNSIEDPSPPSASLKQSAEVLYTAPVIRLTDSTDRHRGGEKLTVAMSGGASTSHTSSSTSEAERAAALSLISLGQGSHSRAVISTSQTQQEDDRPVAKETVLFGNSSELPSPPGASFEQTSDHLYTAPAFRMPNSMDRHCGGEKLTAAMSGGVSTSHTSCSISEVEHSATLGLLSLRQGSHSRVFIQKETKPEPEEIEFELYGDIHNCTCDLNSDDDGGDWDCPCIRYFEFLYQQGHKIKWPVRFHG